MACASSSSDDASRCLLLAVSNDALGVIVDGLADPLQPVVAVALSGLCPGPSSVSVGLLCGLTCFGAFGLLGLTSPA